MISLSAALVALCYLCLTYVLGLLVELLQGGR